MSASNPITEAALRQAIAVAQGRLDDEHEGLRKAEGRLRAAERELALLAELGRMRGFSEIPGANGAEQQKLEAPLSAALNSTHQLMARRAPPASRGALVRTAIDILREHGEPMPIRVLMAELVARGAPIPGRGEQANLISVITRVPEIVRPHRGVYGLREWITEDVQQADARRAPRRKKTGR